MPQQFVNQPLGEWMLVRILSQIAGTPATYTAEEWHATGDSDGEPDGTGPWKAKAGGRQITEDDPGFTLPAADLTEIELAEDDFAWARSADGRPGYWELVPASPGGAAPTVSAWKEPVRCASVANVTVSNPGTSTFDGVTLSSSDTESRRRILLKNQSTGSQNGFYLFNGSSSALTRTTDADTGDEVYGATVFVSEGTVNADTYWTCTNNHTTAAPIVVGTTSLVFAQTPSAGLLISGYVDTGTQSFLGKKTFAGHATNSNPPSIVIDPTSTTATDTVKASGTNPARIMAAATATTATLSVQRDSGTTGGNPAGFIIATNATGGDPYISMTGDNGVISGGLKITQSEDIFGTGGTLPIVYYFSSTNGECLWSQYVVGQYLYARQFIVFDPFAGTSSLGIDLTIDVALNGGGNKVLTFKKGILTSAV